MSPVKTPSPKLRWFWIPLRALLLTFLLTLLSFAVCLLLGILGFTLSAVLPGRHPDLALAYRHFALPAAAVALVISLVAAIALEFRYRM